MAEVNARRRFAGRRTVPIAAVVGGLGALGWAIGAAVDPRHAFFAYLASWAGAVFVATGALIFVTAAHAMSARWVAAVRRLAEAITAALPVLAVGLIPVWIGLTWLYPWVDPPATLSPHELDQLEHKRPWLNPGFFILRSIGYFAVWIATSELLRRAGRARERGAAVPAERERVLSAVALPFLGVTVSFAAFDWLMALQPLWLSTLFGLYVFAAGFVGALALLTVVAWAARRTGALAPELGPDHFHALGRLLLAFLIFWAYCAYFQAMLIRIADLPAEVTFFLRRLEGGWLAVAYLLIVGHFVVPFAILLPRSVKRAPGALAAVASWLLVMTWIDLTWLVLPAAGPGALPGWIDLAAAAGVLGLTVAFAAWRQRGRSLLAEGDPDLAAGLAYRSRS